MLGGQKQCLESNNIINRKKNTCIPFYDALGTHHSILGTHAAVLKGRLLFLRFFLFELYHTYQYTSLNN